MFVSTDRTAAKIKRATRNPQIRILSGLFITDAIPQKSSTHSKTVDCKWRLRTVLLNLDRSSQETLQSDGAELVSSVSDVSLIERIVDCKGTEHLSMLPQARPPLEGFSAEFTRKHLHLKVDGLNMLPQRLRGRESQAAITAPQTNVTSKASQVLDKQGTVTILRVLIVTRHSLPHSINVHK